MRRNELSPFKHTCFHSLVFWRSFTSAAMVTQVGVTTGCTSSFVDWSFSIVRTNLILGQKNHVHDSRKIKLRLKNLSNIATSWLIDYIGFYVLLAIFQTYKGWQYRDQNENESIKFSEHTETWIKRVLVFKIIVSYWGGSASKFKHFSKVISERCGRNTLLKKKSKEIKFVCALQKHCFNNSRKYKHIKNITVS